MDCARHRKGRRDIEPISIGPVSLEEWDSVKREDQSSGEDQPSGENQFSADTVFLGARKLLGTSDVFLGASELFLEISDPVAGTGLRKK